MGKRIGIIAGSGTFPGLVIKEAQQRGYTCIVAGIKEEAEPCIENKAHTFQWIRGGNILNLVSFFRQNCIKKAVMAGKVDHRKIFQTDKLDESIIPLLSDLKERSPTAIVKVLIDFLEREGIQVLDPSPFLAPYFCQEGFYTDFKIDGKLEEDIQFGMDIARGIADLDIGQTVVVKDKTVLAVEGVEGTDEAIKRGGMLAGKGIVVVKASRSSQDMRIDVPAVGFSTINALAEVEGKALCMEAEKVLFFQKEEAVSLAEKEKILIMDRRFNNSH